MAVFDPRLDILPPAQRRLWPELATTPAHFTLYGGTALALRLGHRNSADFDFFSPEAFDPDALESAAPYLRGASRVQVADGTLVCRVQRGGGVRVAFYSTRLGVAAEADRTRDIGLRVASLLDLAGTKVAVVQKRAQARDYIDLDALIRGGIALPTALAAGSIVYGPSFNPLVTLKALSYFDDVPAVPADARKRLAAAAAAVDPTSLPVLQAVRPRPDEVG
jgi:hypothetical protein